MFFLAMIDGITYQITTFLLEYSSSAEPIPSKPAHHTVTYIGEQVVFLINHFITFSVASITIDLTF